MSDRNDLFATWAARHAIEGETPLIKAATVVVVRDGDHGLETLMLRRNSKLEFVGGMWVFPGGRVDPEDEVAGDDFASARNAAAREAAEEAGQRIDPTSLVDFAHWLPPPITPKRFATWFFVTRAGGEAVEIDDGEITEHDWMRPADALERRDAHEIELAPPTWVTLHDLGHYDTTDAALAGMAARETRFYMTRIGRGDDGVPVAMWEGDAGYETADPTVSGARHRLTMASRAYRYEFDH